MSTQSEYELEQQLIAQCVSQGFQSVKLRDEAALLSNLKIQIETVNALSPLSGNEWKQIENHLSMGSLFERAKLLRQHFPVIFDDGSRKHIRFLFDDPSKNSYQICNQYAVDHSQINGHRSRFDVTLLVNGLPLVQIELKKRGMEIAEAFNQVQRYSKAAYTSGKGLFQFVQLFVICNGVNTRYYANGTDHIAFAFSWTDFNNKQLNDVTAFTREFLNISHLNKMLNQYMVLLETTKKLMVLRPYQVYAVEQIVQQVQSGDSYGYIWHTTGSGKTLTSFKASQIIMQMPEVAKVVFVVDRNDLDTQTAQEFNSYKQGSVDSSHNTKVLVKQLSENHDKLIVTTIQKLNIAISRDQYAQSIDYLRDQKVVFIFDECHRSQFGETHRNIKRFFNRAQMFGFTGTPIFKQNAQKVGGLSLTTEYLFERCLHRYVIVDAIRDKNVLPFQIDYRGKYSNKAILNHDSSVAMLENEGNRCVDVSDQVEGIDTKELFENPQRLEMISRYILDIHDTKTKQREFNAIFCVNSVDLLIQYYDLLEKSQLEKQQQDIAQGRIFKPLTVATIFSFAANEEVQAGQSGIIEDEGTEIPSQISQSKRDKLDSYISKYNQQFNTNFNSGDQFYAYYRDIADKVKKRQIDILLVVNMFLTGFDAKKLNTLYVDKNLKHHGLIQAFSRTNRVLNDTKPFGNIICFRNLKQATDEALALFSNKDAQQVVLVSSFEEIQKDYQKAVEKLLELTPDCQDVDQLLTEEQQLEFIKAFRTVMRMNAQLETFVEYDQDQTDLNKQNFADFASKYKDLCQSIAQYTRKDKVSVLNDVDFQLELLHSDRVNVGYIINLLQLVVDGKDDQQRKQYQAQVNDLVAGEVTLHDKQALIKKFIEENIPKLLTGQSVEKAFAAFWDAEKEQAYQHLCQQENLKPEAFKKIIDDYEFTKRLPDLDAVTELMITPPKIRERKTVMANLKAKTQGFIERFYKGL